MKHILVTGANGLLGTEFKARLSSDEAWFCGREELDITDINAVRNFFQNKKIHYIINCAACRDAEYLEDHEIEAEPISVQGPKNLAIVAKENNATLIHVSTDYVFDGKKSSPYVETDAVNPLNIYGKYKEQGEQAALRAAETCLVLRTAWLFSSYGDDFVKKIRDLASTRSELKVIFDQVGSPCYAGDFADYTLQILPKIKTGTKEIYHLTNEGICSWYDLAYATVKAFNLDCQVIPIHTAEFPQKALRPKYSVLDKSKIKRDFNLKIRHYSEGLNDCIQKIKSK